VLKASVERRYKDKDGAWKSSQSFSRNEIPLAVYVLERAFEAIVNEETAQNGDGGNGVGEEAVEKWMRKEWHKAASRRHWAADRKARWADWREQHSRGVARDGAGQPERVSVTPAKVWVRGRVPGGFLDWVERHWAHDNETKAMLSECCFEEWERPRGNGGGAGKATRPA